MQGVVPAAGEGTRLRPLTADQPKGLVEVAGKPLLSHVFETLREMGVAEIVVIVGYRGEQIRNHYGDRFGDVPLTYVSQSERLGLAHALLQAAPEIDGDFVLLNGDNVARANTAALVERHERSDAAISTLVEEVSAEQADKGAVFERDGEEITGLVEKPAEPPSRLVPRGIYAFSELILPACEIVRPDHTGEYELTAAVDLLLTAGHSLQTIPLAGWICNVNTPEDIERVEHRLG